MTGPFAVKLALGTTKLCVVMSVALLGVAATLGGPTIVNGTSVSVEPALLVALYCILNWASGLAATAARSNGEKVPPGPMGTVMGVQTPSISAWIVAVRLAMGPLEVYVAPGTVKGWPVLMVPLVGTVAGVGGTTTCSGTAEVVVPAAFEAAYCITHARANRGLGIP